MASKRVIVVGAGVFGATASLELKDRGHDVTLIDRAQGPHPDASSTDVSKMVRMDYGSDVFYHELAETALDGWDRWNAEWPTPLYHDQGFLVLAPRPMQPGGFEFESWRVLRERGYDPERIDSRLIASRYPAWNADRFPDGYLSRRGGWAQSGDVVDQLLRLAEAAGVRRAFGRVSALTTSDSRVEGVVLEAEGGGERQSLTADYVVLCAGAWTPLLVPELAEGFKPIAQPVVHLGVSDPNEYRGSHFPPFAADTSGSGWYGFPATDAGFVKLGHHSDGAVVAADDRGEVSEEHVALVRSFLSDALPSLADAPIVGRRVCLYADSFDGDLLVDRHPDVAGLVVATGGSGHAFKFAPELGAMIADVVEDKPNRWLARFRWRTSGAPGKEAARHSSK